MKQFVVLFFGLALNIMLLVRSAIALVGCGVSKTPDAQPQRLSRLVPQDTVLCGDVDGSGTVTITDVVYTVRYIFAGGPAPCAPRTRSVVLQWTAVGDDSLTGTAAEYDIRYDTIPITMATWDQATQCVGEPSPQVSGSQEQFTVTGLLPNVTYCFAIKVRDDAGNWSWISNVVWR